MSGELLLVAAAAIAIAYANGQNDVSKGIATLVGSGVTSYRRAIVWGSVWTGVGGIAGAALAGAMLTTFGNGLLTTGATPTLATALAVVLGAAAWVAIASRTGLPVSTTHALVGALVGVAIVAFGTAGIRWGVLGYKIAVPLLVGPFVALAITATLLRFGRRRASADCACLAPGGVAATVPGALAHTFEVPAIVVGSRAECERAHPTAVRITIDHLHWLTSGAASFARGLNDAPKIVALVLSGAALAGDGVALSTWFVVVTAAMVAGSLVGGLRVTRVLAEDVTRMDHREGFIANLTTATLVTLAAVKGMPLSTTHVASGAIIGAGTARRDRIDWRTVRKLAMAWIVTLPLAAALAIGVYVVLQAALP